MLGACDLGRDLGDLVEQQVEPAEQRIGHAAIGLGAIGLARRRPRGRRPGQRGTPSPEQVRDSERRK
jgi:hypothetical protein